MSIPGAPAGGPTRPVPPSTSSVAALFVGTTEVGPWVRTVESLRRAHPEVVVVCGAPDPAALAPLTAAGAVVVTASSAAVLVDRLYAEHRSHVLLVGDPALFPARALDPALSIVERNLRVATVSFLGQGPGFLSFPVRNQPLPPLAVPLDAGATTEALRSTTPALGPATIPFASGPAVLLAAAALSAVGPVDDSGGRTDLAVADFSARARRRGFIDVVDPETFVARVPSERPPPGDLWADPAKRGQLVERHPFLDELTDQEAASPHSPLGLVHAAARAKVVGVRLLVDATWIGPWEMGTQVQTVAMVNALSRRPEIESVTVALSSTLPRTVDALLANPRVIPRAAPFGDLSEMGPADVVHRPFQPDGPLDVLGWRRIGARTVLTLLDLIGFHVGAYHSDGEHWAGFRRNLRIAVSKADGVVVPADDVVRQIHLEHLYVEPDRLFVVGLGTDHLRGDEPQAPPAAFARGDLDGAPFLLVLGTDYAHKNRDLAIAAFAELRRRGFPGSLVLVGPSIQFGSSQASEARAVSAAAVGDRVLSLDHVAAYERNWLLHHASLVLYPTSAEGFGFVPYEAARFGTSTVLVPVGPLEVVAADLPVTASGWDATSLADAAACLLDDPALADAQVKATLAAAQTQTWDATASHLIDVYRSLLARPPLGG